MHQLIGEGGVDKEDGIKEDTKEGWLKEVEIQVIPASTVDNQAIMLGTAHRDKGRTPNPTSSISTTMTNQNLPRRIKSPTSDPRSIL